MTLYDRIKDLRIKCGLSQQELARLTGYQDRSSIAKIESGNVDLPQSKIILFSKVLDVTPAYLMGLEDCSHTIKVSDHERKVILAYRSNPSMQEAVDRLLQVPADPASNPKQA